MKRSIGVAAQSLRRLRRFDLGQRLKAPMARAGPQIEAPGRRGLGGGRGVAPGSAAADPLDQRGDFLGRQLRFGGHLIRIAVANRIDQQALVGLARHDGRRGVAPLEHGVARVEPQVALLLPPAVALVTAGRQERPHLLLEELDIGRVGGWVGRGRRVAGGWSRRLLVERLGGNGRKSSHQQHRCRDETPATEQWGEPHSDCRPVGRAGHVSERESLRGQTIPCRLSNIVPPAQPVNDRPGRPACRFVSAGARIASCSAASGACGVVATVSISIFLGGCHGSWRPNVKSRGLAGWPRRWLLARAFSCAT